MVTFRVTNSRPRRGLSWLKRIPVHAKEKLGWETKTTFEQLIQMMVESDLAIVQEAVDGGYAPPTPPE